MANSVDIQVEKLMRENPIVASLLNKRDSNQLTPSEITQLAAFASAYSEAYDKIAQKDILVPQIAALKVKIDSNIATEAEKADYQSKTSQFKELNNSINTIQVAALTDLATLQDKRKQDLLDRLKTSQSGSMANPTDLYEYIVRTQALNPYSRERACDTNFLDLLLKVASDTNSSKDIVKQVKEHLTSS